MDKKDKKECIEVEVPESRGRDFQAGNYLNVIDEITCIFVGKNLIDHEDIKNALKLYVGHIENQY